MRERRAHPRFPVGECGLVCLRGDNSDVWEREVHILDISESGVRIQLDRPIPIGSQVEVVVDTFRFTGSVVYCQREGNCFGAGVAAWGQHFPPLSSPP